MAGRQLANLKQKRSGNISGSDERGDSRNIAARATGLGSGKTLEAAQRVAEGGENVIMCTDVIDTFGHSKLFGVIRFRIIPF